MAQEFFAWVKERIGLKCPGSYLSKAFRYALGQEACLLRCVADGRFELDTGRVERQIRELVISRKNDLFSGCAAAARRPTNAYTLVRSCQNLRLNTRAYLPDVITELQVDFPLRDINRLRPDVLGRRR